MLNTVVLFTPIFKIFLGFNMIVVLFTACQNKSNSNLNKNTDQNVKIEKPASDVINDSASYRFESFYKKIPDLVLPITLWEQKPKKIPFEQWDDLVRNEFAVGEPCGKIVRDSFVAIIYTQYAQDLENNILQTYDLNGNKISDIEVYAHYERWGPSDISLENCKTTIDKNFNIHYTYKCIETNKLDTIKNIFENKYYKILYSGNIIEIKNL